MKTFFDRHPHAFRLLFGLLAVPVLWAIAENLYFLANRGSDDSAFQTSVSRLYVSADFHANRIVNIRRPYLTFQKIDRGRVRAGDLIHGINGQVVRTSADVEKALALKGDRETLTIEVQRPVRRDFFIEFEVSARNLPDSFYWEIPPTVYVWRVPPGGASARAGMRPGDLIHQINGKNFKDRNEAEQLVKSTLRGQTVDYGIIRRGSFLTLKVTMA